MVLRTIPFLITRFGTPSPGTAYLPIGYNPKDWLAYAGFISQAQTGGGLLLANPFTTEPQGDRFLLIYHSVLGWTHRLTGIDPFWLLELSRIPLLLLFTVLLWRFLEPLLPELRTREWACWFVLLAGGLEIFLLPLADALPPQLAQSVRQDLWHLQGWNTFQSFYNPLWIAGLCLSLLTLRPVFQKESLTPREQVKLAVGFLALFYTHPYSAIVVAAVFICVPLLHAILREPLPMAALKSQTVAFLPAFALIGAISLWQRQDAVFKACSGGVFGTQALSVFWYPVTLGVCGVMALRGVAGWIRTEHPARFALGAWLIAVMLLHSSTLLNGYHFVSHLFIPVSILAARGLSDTLAGLSAWRGWAALCLSLAFLSPLYVTYQSIQDVDGRSRTVGLYLTVVEKLKSHPPGNVLAPAQLGGLVPAYTQHRVFVGQWFLTPFYDDRSREVAKLLEGQPADAPALQKLVDSQRIAYIVAPLKSADALARNLGSRVTSAERVDQAVILVLKTP